MFENVRFRLATAELPDSSGSMAKIEAIECLDFFYESFYHTILRDRLGKGKHHTTVRLMYRSMSQDLADNLGIEGLEVPGIEMASARLTFDY